MIGAISDAFIQRQQSKSLLVASFRTGILVDSNSFFFDILFLLGSDSIQLRPSTCKWLESRRLDALTQAKCCIGCPGLILEL